MNVAKEKDVWMTINVDGTDYFSDSMNKIYSLKSNHKTCDILINSNEKKIYAHKIILAAHSPYFHNLFYGEFREAQKTNTLMEIDLSQFQPKLVEAAIDNMYSTATRIPMNPLNIAEFLCLASFLQYSYLEEQVSSMISEDIMTPETSLFFSTLSSRVHDVDLQLKAFFSLKTHFQLVLDTEFFVKQDIDTLRMLLKLDDLNIDSEYTMFEAVVKWISFDLDTRIAYLKELLDYVRFEHIESGMGSEAFLNHHLIKDSEQLLNETKLYFLNRKSSWNGNQFTSAPDELRVRTDRQNCVVRKKRSYPEELIVFARYQPVVGNPTEKCWREGGVARWFDSSNEKYLPFKWRTELYRIDVVEGSLEEFNVFYKGDCWEFVHRCGLLKKELKKARWKFFQSRADLSQVHVIDDTLFVLLENVDAKRYFICRFDLKNFETIGNAKLIPGNINSDSIVYTKDFLYAFTEAEFIQICLNSDEGVKTLCQLEEHQKRKHLSVIEKNGVIYFGGGRGDLEFKKLKSVFAYNIRDNKWKPLADFTQARSNFWFVMFKNVLCAVGGNDGDSITFEVYDEVSNKWELDTSFPLIRWICKPSKNWPPVTLPVIPWKFQ